MRVAAFLSLSGLCVSPCKEAVKLYCLRAHRRDQSVLCFVLFACRSVRLNERVSGVVERGKEKGVRERERSGG